MFPSHHSSVKILPWALTFFVTLLTTGCRRGEGTISGTVILQGTPPPERIITFDALSARLQITNPVTTRHYIVDTNGGLANVLVYIKDQVAIARAKPQTNVASLEIHRAVYEPYVQAVLTNQPIQLRNRDPILHSASVTPPRGNTNKALHIAMTALGAVRSLAFNANTVVDSGPKEPWRERIARWLRLKPAAKPAVGPRASPFMRFGCDVHPWELGYVAVLDHPFFAVTGQDGTFELPPLPAGRYTLEAVHLKAGTNTQQITIANGERKRATIVMKAPQP